MKTENPMTKIVNVIEKLDLETVILNGLSKLAGDERAMEVWETLTTWTFSVNYRATGRLGQCQYRHRNIEVSVVLTKPEHRSKLNNTILHEIAHAVNPMLFGRNDGHGPNWRRIMYAFEERAERRNSDKDVSADLQERRKAKAKQLWACQKCEQEYPILKRRKYPISSYKCGKCRNNLYVKRCADGRTSPNPKKQVN